MKYKYNVKDVVYIQSRYDGILKRTIVSLTEIEFNDVLSPAYELDNLVEFQKNGNSFGSKEIEMHEGGDDGFMYYETYYCYPAPETLLIQIGDYIVHTDFISMGTISDVMLTEDMVNLED